MSSRPSRGAARLAAILDALPDALVLVNANGTVVNANTIALEAFEAPGTALVGRGLLDLLPEFDSRLIPGSMRRPATTDPRGRTKPKRMTARRTDGGEFPVEVTSANLENGQQAYDGHGYTGDELLMLVVRDLSGTVDTEAELARSQRQTEMILRAASEGVIGTDLDGRIVLVNPAAAQILGYRANDLGGKELHTLVLHSRDDGEPFPYEGSPLADTLKSGRKHRVRGQVLWSKKGDKVPVDLTTAPVRDGDQLVGAVMTFTDRRPYDALAQEKDRAEREHTAELARLREGQAAELAEHAELHAEEIAAEKDRYAALAEREQDRHEAQGARYEQLLAVLDGSLRGPLDELRHELAGLAADDAGQLWPEANQILHHLAAGYSRITTLVDNVLRYQRLDCGAERLTRRPVMLDAVVAAGVDGAVELIGPGRAQFAVHAPPIEAEVDPERLATALAHLVADVAGVDSTGNAPVAADGYMDSTIVVAAAQRGEVVRIEVRGPYGGGDPVHEPIVRGIVRAHGGVLQTHEVPGAGGSAFVLEVPIGGGAGAVPAGQPAHDPVGVDGSDGSGLPAGGTDGSGSTDGGTGGGRRRARRGSTDAFLEGAPPHGRPDDGAEGGADGTPTGRRRGRRAAEATPDDRDERAALAQASGGTDGTGRRRGRPSGAQDTVHAPVNPPANHPVNSPVEGYPNGPAGLGQVPPGGQGGGQPGGQGGGQPGGQGAQVALRSGPGTGGREGGGAGVPALPPAAPADPSGPQPVNPAGLSGHPGHPGQPSHPGQPVPPGGAQQNGRRTRRALAPAADGSAEEVQGGPRSAFALPPAEADRPVDHMYTGQAGRDRRVPGGGFDPAAQQGGAPHDPIEEHTPPQPHPTERPTGRRRAVGSGVSGAPEERPDVEVPRPGEEGPAAPPYGLPAPAHPQVAGYPSTVAVPHGAHGAQDGPVPPQGIPSQAAPPYVPQAPTATEGAGVPVQMPHAAQGGQPLPPAQPVPGTHPVPAGHPAQPAQPTGSTWGTPAPGASLPPQQVAPPRTPGTETQSGGAQSGTARDSRVVPDSPGAQDPHATATQGRAFSVRTLGQGVPVARSSSEAPPAPPVAGGQGQPAGSGAANGSGRRRKLGTRPDAFADEPDGPDGPGRPLPPQQSAPAGAPQRLAGPATGPGRSYAIGAPDQHAAEGPEPLDGPGGAVEIADQPHPRPMDDELPPEPLDNPRRLLVWPAPDMSTQQALSDRGYRPVIVHSREEVDAQIAAFPAALFVDPLTGPITRTALQSLRQAAVAAEVPVLVTAGLGQATREAAYGADPAVLLKALAPRDSEQHPSRVLLIEEHPEIALALTSTLERRGMQVARAVTDADAVTLATQMRPNLVVMDLMQVRRRRAGIVDWLRANGQLNRTPLVVYTAAVDHTELPRLAAGETVLFLAERSTSAEVQSRIVDLLARIGTN
ncbi:PAS domain-containing protein [Streptomyces sp. NPDC127068]|uniref:PAS domain-containing protein n=1 Tax=Streptomyces sp. NPDC127068 TaxID=3347127 RepID=UPI00365CC625